MEEDLKDLLEENGNLRRENHLLNDQVNSRINFKLFKKIKWLFMRQHLVHFWFVQMERLQDEGERKLVAKAAEVDELFKRVEELEEENFAVKGQVQ